MAHRLFKNLYKSHWPVRNLVTTGHQNSKVRQWNFLKWGAVISGGSSACIGYLLFKEDDITVNEYRHNKTVILYRRLPLNALSRAWGWANDVDLPLWLRGPVLRLYARTFGCELAEAVEEDPKAYRNLGEFFRRAIKTHLRPIDPQSCLTSPADGRVLHFGRVESGHLEQVKGLSYTLQGFLGPPSWNADAAGQLAKNDNDLDEADYQRALHLRPGHELFHCVIYLAPGDYHRFHSAADWTVRLRRHFPGNLLSVNPRMASWICGLFAINERAVYVGDWRYGFFSYTAVGATNVGSISVFCDKDLKTNARSSGKEKFFQDKVIPDVACSKGDLFGEFQLGSTLVLVFEAPSNFRFNFSQGDQVRVGQSLGDLLTASPAESEA